ncbi:hypothetical protein EJ05DRAFT_476654 [Pseudovirgaria hyperparasitica]|uniref:Capsule polysaccharide biosynthesis protein n=1 Tax=Pseudovirgaria hyperparasitica TaxID=470096 RepID=A0A6A6W741_9PEZI|nr:uncharacterized protein EJ05DRAFT_476654 [Pseudovirgaria hyperparasitica]KAF2757387.1 hypothetical protein EJ05DRAFT_476654 [Pseudovirgaria hyperparasitica]
MPYPDDYPIPPGVHAIPHHLLDLRPDSEIDAAILNPPPVTSPKNIWFYWNTGYATMHPYAQRTVRAWHRRLSKHGWTIRVLDRSVPSSPSHISAFVPLTPSNFPTAFLNGTLTGPYAQQHYSDLVRWPLLLAHGGVYADVGLMLIGDLDRLWSSTIADPSSPFTTLSFNAGPSGLTNYFLAALPLNPFFARCHTLFLRLWAENGGRDSTLGMRDSPLLAGLPPWDGAFSPDVKARLEDYIAQGRVMQHVMQSVDAGDDAWDGPAYVRTHVYAPDYTEHSQLINEFTSWSGPRAYALLSLRLPGADEEEDEDHAHARTIVESCLSRSFAFKLAHGLIVSVLGETLGSLWRDNEGSDVGEGTYAAWLRHGMVFWTQDGIPTRMV